MVATKPRQRDMALNGQFDQRDLKSLFDVPNVDVRLNTSSLRDGGSLRDQRWNLEANAGQDRTRIALSASGRNNQPVLEINGPGTKDRGNFNKMVQAGQELVSSLMNLGDNRNPGGRGGRGGRGRNQGVFTNGNRRNQRDNDLNRGDTRNGSNPPNRQPNQGIFSGMRTDMNLQPIQNSAGGTNQNANNNRPANGTSSNKQPLIGIIERDGFAPGSHGGEMLETVTSVNDQAPTWLRSVGERGNWAEALKEFANTVKASGQKGIANLSFDLVNPNGQTRFQPTAQEQEALKLTRDLGIPVVVSAGNQAADRSSWDALTKQYDNMIVVGASEGLNRAPYSSYGSGLDLMAPGSRLGISEIGTSPAAAQVTGVASNVWASNPQLDYRQLEQILKNTATNLGPAGRDNQTGFGLVNPNAAIDRAESMHAFKSSNVTPQGNPNLRQNNLSGREVLSALRNFSNSIPTT
ncbi:S8/S53 family peptidase [Leptolyngbya sp. NK1-12]|uniref:S8/S53 family peptidase n=1 Tax=Leptolyngbya sp. NK1-12 TaxID=2547451 RepID=A0AA97AGW1_9CYAN|nr:S8/S53 family peptidase [Leptolyngbya sp. NK1-12]WNZ24765.1 S8/S53 family peptidase [Leptolyngbya sp. NK1-12]